MEEVPKPIFRESDIDAQTGTEQARPEPPALTMNMFYAWMNWLPVDRFDLSKHRWVMSRNPPAACVCICLICVPRAMWQSQMHREDRGGPDVGGPSLVQKHQTFQAD